MLSSGREAGDATFAATIIGFAAAAADVAVRDGVVVANALFASGLRNAWKSDIFPAPPPLSVVFSFLAVGRFTTVSIIGVSNSLSSSSDNDDERNVGVIEEKGTTNSFLLLLSLKLASKASSNASSSSSSFTSSVVNSISESVTSSSESSKTSTFLRIKALLLLCCTTISSSESSSSKSSSSFPLFLLFREGGDLDDAFILVRIFIFFMKKREVFPLWH